MISPRRNLIALDLLIGSAYSKAMDKYIIEGRYPIKGTLTLPEIKMPLFPVFQHLFWLMGL